MGIFKEQEIENMDNEILQTQPSKKENE